MPSSPMLERRQRLKRKIARHDASLKSLKQLGGSKTGPVQQSTPASSPPHGAIEFSFDDAPLVIAMNPEAMDLPSLDEVIKDIRRMRSQYASPSPQASEFSKESDVLTSKLLDAAEALLQHYVPHARHTETETEQPLVLSKAPGPPKREPAFHQFFLPFNAPEHRGRSPALHGFKGTPAFASFSLGRAGLPEHGLISPSSAGSGSLIVHPSTTPPQSPTPRRTGTFTGFFRSREQHVSTSLVDVPGFPTPQSNRKTDKRVNSRFHRSDSVGEIERMLVFEDPTTPGNGSFYDGSAGKSAVAKGTKRVRIAENVFDSSSRASKKAKTKKD